jgi:hypothetical protein
MVFNGRMFWEFPSSIKKLRGNNYYKDFHAYLRELKLILNLFFFII